MNVATAWKESRERRDSKASTELSRLWVSEPLSGPKSPLKRYFGVGVGLGVGVEVGVGVAVGVGVGVGVDVGSGVAVGVGVGVDVAVGVAVAVGCGVAVGVGVAVASSIAVGVEVAVGVGVGSGVGVDGNLVAIASMTMRSIVASRSGVDVGSTVGPGVQAATTTSIAAASHPNPYVSLHFISLIPYRITESRVSLSGSCQRDAAPGPRPNCVAAPLGLEPRSTDPKSAVLPLHHGAKRHH